MRNIFYVVSTYFLISSSAFGSNEFFNNPNPIVPEDSVKSKRLDPSEKVGDLVITGISVISMVDDRILKNQTILIKDSQITDIYSSNNQSPNATRVIDGSGKFIIPGLHDMHTHVASEGFAQAIGVGDVFKNLPYEDLLSAYLANGITTIQVLAGGADLLEVRNKIKEGEMTGPRIIVGSPMLDGNPPVLPEPFTKSISEISEVEPLIREMKSLGYDFLKLRVNLPKPIFDEIMDIAKKLGMPVIGHVPRGAGLDFDYVISKKDFGIAHIEEFGYDNSTPNEKAIMHYIDLLKTNNSYAITTLTVFDNILAKMTDYDATLGSEKTKYIHPLPMALWKNNPFRQEQTKERFDQIKSQLDYQKLLVNKLYKAGIPIMIGTDALNPTIVPGFSIHRELELIRESGLSSYDALRMATVVPAKKISPANELAGTISKGQIANLVILDSNPLKELNTLRKPEYVILKGDVLDKSQLQEMLEELARKVN